MIYVVLVAGMVLICASTYYEIWFILGLGSIETIVKIESKESKIFYYIQQFPFIISCGFLLDSFIRFQNLDKEELVLSRKSMLFHFICFALFSISQLMLVCVRVLEQNRSNNVQNGCTTIVILFQFFACLTLLRLLYQLSSQQSVGVEDNQLLDEDVLSNYTLSLATVEVRNSTVHDDFNNSYSVEQHLFKRSKSMVVGLHR